MIAVLLACIVLFIFAYCVGMVFWLVVFAAAKKPKKDDESINVRAGEGIVK